MTTTSQTETFRIADLPEDDAQALMAAIYHNAERNMEHYRREVLGDIGMNTYTVMTLIDAQKLEHVK